MAPPKSSSHKPPTTAAHCGERRVQCNSCWLVVSVGSALTTFTCPVCKTTKVLNNSLRTSASHQVSGVPKAKTSALHNFINVLKVNQSRDSTPHQATGLPKAKRSVTPAPHQVIGVPNANPSTGSAPRHVTGVPKANLSKASAPHQVTGVLKANASRASVPHHVTSLQKANLSSTSAPHHHTSAVPKTNPSRASASDHVIGLQKAKPSSASAPHHISDVPKTNPSRASASDHFTGLQKAKPLSASAPHHTRDVPKTNPSRASASDHVIDLQKAKPSSASAPHHTRDVPKTNPSRASAHVSREVEEIAAEMEQEEDEGGTMTETFTDYRPSRLSIGLLHPDPIVETSSLSGVTTPEPKYNLKIEGLLGCSKALSCLQIETLVYASQRHLQHLQDGTRAGFLIGDGAGVGKGRTVAGLIWENWWHSRTKALWISVGSDLKFDARRDLDDVGAECIKVHALNKLPYSKLDSESVGVRDGVIFLTYSSLIASSASGSRVDQLVEWCGPGYDGLIIFDECHKAKNLGPEGWRKATLTGKAVKEIQEKLPEARVVYCSATGASEPMNMAYMVRLGLWGDGTCFRDFTDFTNALNDGGVGALELVAMDMKARGMYLCRTLSYKGAEFEVVEAPLTVTMVETYKAAVKLWVALRKKLLRSSDQPKTLWMSYWSAHQKFFKHMCMSAKVPTIVRLAKQALREGKCVVIGLQCTGEARTEDVVAKYGSELDDFISGPRELLLKFVKEYVDEGDCFSSQSPVKVPGKEKAKVLKRKRNSATPGVPAEGWDHKVARMKFECEEFFFNECHGIIKGSETRLKNEPSESVDKSQSGTCEICYYEEGMNKLLKCTTCGQLAHPACLDPHVVPARAGKWSCNSCEQKPNGRKSFSQGKPSLIDKILSLDLPRNPLDDIIDQLGGPDKVAEITGRQGMLVRNSSGEGVSYRARKTKKVSKDMVNMHEKQQFMDGKKLIAIISEAGSVGVSLQADRRAGNQRRRVHLTLELPWSADKAIQQFGRTHRSNQTSAPQYRLIFTDLGGERRFASTVAKRLESLGALTQGDRRAGPSLSAYNYVTIHGRKALEIIYWVIMEKATFPVPPPGCSFANPDSIKDYIARAKKALVSVGIIKKFTELTGRGWKKISVELGDKVIEADMLKVERFLNRLLGMRPEIQNSLFELFVTTLEHVIQKERSLGTFDKGVIDYKAGSIKLGGTPKTVYIDRTSGATAKLYKFKVDRGITWETAFALLAEKQISGSSSLNNNGFYKSGKGWMGRRHFLLAYESSTSGMYKILRPYEETEREMSLKELQSKYTKIENLEKARTGWEDEYTVSAKQCLHGPNCKKAETCTAGTRLRKVFVLGGVILPVWSIVQKTLAQQEVKSNRRLQVMHIETTDETLRLVGFRIPQTAVKSLREVLKWAQDVTDT